MVQGLKGVHHVGIGVQHYDLMKQFYSDVLQCKDVFGGEFKDVHNAMPEVFRQSAHKFSGIIFRQEAGGIFVELIKMSYPIPRPIRRQKRYGDIGMNKMIVSVDDVERFYAAYKDKANLVSEPKSVALPGRGEYQFVYGRDPEGNLIEFAEWPEMAAKDLFGGVRCLGISCVNLEESMAFYRDLSFDTVEVEPHDAFSGMVDEVSGAKDTQVRSCLLSSSEGGGMLELFELLVPRGRAIPLNTNWGDFGYLEVCLDSDDVHAVSAYCIKEDIMLLHSPSVAFAMGDVDMWFMYAYDPNGCPVEVIAEMPAVHNIYKHA
jgi:catechol 2,3-dioxygenase-like lactoylglutathione lyase family enzyme